MVDDREHLGSIPPERAPEWDLVDIYVTYNFAEAEMIHEILVENDIDCHIRKLDPPQFPVNTGKHGQIRVDVPNDKVEKAVGLLHEAIEAEALADDGEFLVE